MPSEKKYLVASIILFLVEVFIGIYVHDTIVRPYIGDLLFVVLLYCMLKAVCNMAVMKAGIVVLLFAYLVETLQYFNIANVLGLGNYKFARILIGNSFSRADMACYTIGIAIVLLVEKLNHKQVF